MAACTTHEGEATSEAMRGSVAIALSADQNDATCRTQNKTHKLSRRNVYVIEATRERERERGTQVHSTALFVIL